MEKGRNQRRVDHRDSLAWSYISLLITVRMGDCRIEEKL